MRLNHPAPYSDDEVDAWREGVETAVERDDTAELVEALEAIAAGAPTERPDWYEGDNGTDIALNAAHIEHFRVAEIARAALAKWKERNDE